MLQTDVSNNIFKLAADFVNNTSRHIFLTGKAGTGKTTFLKYIKENTQKQTVVIAPTGLAAINAGGVTMHSFFQLPFGPYIPGTNRGFAEDNNVSDKHSLFKNIRFNTDKRQLLEELELLIIDEISMVRADMLDAMDTILRHFRKKLHQPFGGVQVLYIGDMYQLPPVVTNNEWDILRPWYDSPFFFSAQVVAAAPPLYIELKKIYRQNEQQFIDILNRLRNNQLSDADFSLLNSRYQPDFTPAKEEKYITLSTHNKRADAINAAELEKLAGNTTVFNAVITGDFSDKALPTDMNLHLKEGAQVMFIKNDSGTERKYFNGKLAIIKKINAGEIIVKAYDNDEELEVEKVTWLNVRYTYNKEKNSIEEEELGSFTQYPLRLAWAITIHKSQGLTFNKAIIDAGGSFAAGQVYVALSRCTSLNGIVLLTKLYPSAIATDNRVIEFAQKEAASEELQQILQSEQEEYLTAALIKTFSFKRILDAIEDFNELIPGKKLPDIKAALALGNRLSAKSKELAAVADKFQQQLQQLALQMPGTGNISILEERVNKAITYFIKSIAEDLLQPLREHSASLQHAVKARKYVTGVWGIEAILKKQMLKIMQAGYGDIAFCKEPAIYNQYFAEPAAAGIAVKPASYKPVKGSSDAETLALFKQGKTIEEIAELRQLAESTINGHLATFVRTGGVDIYELLTEEKVNIILPVVKEVGGHAITPIKERLSDDFSFADIRIVLNHWLWLQQKKVNT